MIEQDTLEDVQATVQPAPSAEESISPAPEPAFAKPSPAAPPDQRRSLLRVAYAAQFWLALIGTLVVWSEVGGQGHLDLMPWYVKLPLVFALAWCSVRMTAAMAERARAWNARSIAWAVAIALLACVMGAITYYYHINESQDDPDTDQESGTAVMLTQPAAAHSDLT